MELYLSDQNITEEEFNAFEKLVGASLGHHFKSFYLKNNGGVPSHEYYQGFTIQVFSPIKYGDYTIEEKLERFRKHNPSKLNYVPFGHDGGGNPYLLDTSSGAIYIIYMGEEELNFVANSFEELVKGLTDEME